MNTDMPAKTPPGLLPLPPGRPRRLHHGWYFALTTVLTLVMLCGMTFYYSFRELRSSAQDLAGALLRNAESQQGLGLSASDIVQQSLQAFHDAQEIELCLGSDCARHGAAYGLPLSPSQLQGVGWPCASATLPRSGGTAEASVCMAIEDVLEDIGRDVAILLVAQSMGFGIWLTASRRFAARRKIWSQRVSTAVATDGATGLLNRASFRAKLDEAATRGDEGWLVLAGIDELKAVNELHGGAVGDQMIQSVAQRLQGLGDSVQALGRTGGDEFAFIVAGQGQMVLERSLSRLRSAMNPPLEYHGLLLGISVSAGAAAFEPQLGASELIRRANVALRAAKKVGADSQSIFNLAYDIELRKKHQLRLDLMAAVDKNQLQLVYQPIVDGRGNVVVAEALARWNHPQLGFVPPDVFIAAAEASGLIHELGISLLKRACADLLAARQRGLPLQRMAVNLSPAQLTHPDLTSLVLAVVQGAGLQPADIELELTESAAMTSRQDSSAVLHELAEAGFSIAIDDFGTGYSSLSRLQHLPIRKLKIDKSFVQANDVASGAVLLEAMLDLARRLGLSCVAEGVETPAQMQWLRERGCELFQGYLIGKPMPLEQLAAMGSQPAPARSAGLRPDQAMRAEGVERCAPCDAPGRVPVTGTAIRAA